MVYKSIIGAICVYLAVTFAPAHASFIYTYTGNNFTHVHGVYDTTMSIDATIELNSELGSNLDWLLVNPFSFSISDGINVLTQDTVKRSEFKFTTDVNGVITDWSVTAWSNDTFNTAGDSNLVLETFMLHNFGAIDAALVSICEVSNECLYSNQQIYNENQSTPGVWTMNEVPVPPTVWLFGSGLLGLVGLARRKANA